MSEWSLNTLLELTYFKSDSLFYLILKNDQGIGDASYIVLNKSFFSESMVAFAYKLSKKFQLNKKVEPITIFSVDKVTMLNYYTMLFQLILYLCVI